MWSTLDLRCSMGDFRYAHKFWAACGLPVVVLTIVAVVASFGGSHTRAVKAATVLVFLARR